MENKVIVANGAKGTSRAAAERAYPKSGSIRLKIYEYIIRKELEGATDQEIESSLHIDGNTVRPSRKTLEDDGFIIDSGTTRANKNGNQCIVWRAASINMLL